MSYVKKESCETCRYYASQAAREGLCRRFPPGQIVSLDRDELGGFNVISDFLAVGAHQWCGEYQEKR